MKKNFKMTYLSHPNKQLSVHLKNVANKGEEIIKKKDLNLSLIKKEDLIGIYKIISLFHDFGKYSSDFQKKLLGKKDYDNEKSKHSIVSSLVCFLVLKEYCEKNNLPLIFADIGAFIIKRHHGDLDSVSNWLSINREENQDIILAEQFNEIFNINKVKEYYSEELNKFSLNFDISIEKFKKLINKNKFDIKKDFKKKLNKIRNAQKIELFLITESLFSVLIDCDKKDAAGFKVNTEIAQINPNSVQEYLTKKIKETPEKFNPNLKINQIKNNIFKSCVENPRLSSKNKIYTITAPTGAGKTLTSLATALKLKSQINSGKNYRIHYILPFTTIIDQNYNVFREVLANQFNDKNENNFIMKHHYLTTENLKKQDELNKDYNFSSYMDELLFLKSWDSALVVSSYVQLLETIIGKKNSFMNKFHSIINSIIILDEVQCISSRYWDLFREVFLELANKFNTYFIFLTATQPLIFNRFNDKQESLELTKPKEIFKEECINRVNLFIDNTEKTISEFIEEIKNWKKLEKRYLFILNTKKSSLELYNKLKELSLFNKYKKIYLSTNLTPYDRERKIEKLIGKKKENSSEWEIKPLEKYVVVTTQLIEAGVDISSDVCYRDFAPIDSLIQSAGRVNRFGELKDKKGKVYFIKLKDEKKNRLFSDFIYRDEPVLEWTKNVLSTELNSSKNFYNLSEEFFKHSLTKEGKTKLLCISEEETIKNLNFEHNFKFIQNQPTYSVFILNKISQELLNKYKEIYNKKEEFEDFFSWKGELKRIRKQFQNFTIEIWPKKFEEKFAYLKNDIKELGEEFFYLDTNEFPKLYNDETGFDIGYEDENII